MIRFRAKIVIAGAFFLLAKGLVADPEVSPADTKAAKEAAYSAAKAVTVTNSSPEAAAALGHASFDLADVEESKKRKASIAEVGIAACERGLSGKPSSAELHYYLAENMGSLAATKMLGALSLLRKMEEHWQKALFLDPTLDYAGPDRSLGLLYQQAPGWPTSLGSKSKARQHFEHAIELAPDFPENRIVWTEALKAWGEKGKAKESLSALDAMWTDARAKYSGPRWAADWTSWERRRDKLRSELEK